MRACRRVEGGTPSLRGPVARRGGRMRAGARQGRQNAFPPGSFLGVMEALRECVCGFPLEGGRLALQSFAWRNAPAVLGAKRRRVFFCGAGSRGTSEQVSSLGGTAFCLPWRASARWPRCGPEGNAPVGAMEGKMPSPQEDRRLSRRSAAHVGSLEGGRPALHRARKGAQHPRARRHEKRLQPVSCRSLPLGKMPSPQRDRRSATACSGLEGGTPSLRKDRRFCDGMPSGTGPRREGILPSLARGSARPRRGWAGRETVQRPSGMATGLSRGVARLAVAWLMVAAAGRRRSGAALRGGVETGRVRPRRHSGGGGRGLSAVLRGARAILPPAPCGGPDAGGRCRGSG